MAYKQIKVRKIYEEIADQLIEMIKSGELKPGMKLDSVQKLAENFQVGRSAVREALSALRAMGLVVMHQGEGTYIREFDPKVLSQSISTAVLMKKDDIQDLLEVRKILEVGSVASAALKRTEEDLNAIENALEEMRKADGNKELGEKADLDFHMAITKASHNRLLIDLMHSVSEIMIETMRETRNLWLYSEKATVERLYQEHKQIFEALKAQKVDESQQLMLGHLMKVEQVLMKYVDRR